MTLAEKILTAHTDKETVSPGEFINVKVDLILANDITAPIAIREFRKMGVGRVFDPKKIVMVPDHFTPNKDIASAEQAKLVRDFAREQEIIYFEVGQVGIEHVLDVQTMASHLGQNALGVSTRIDDGPLFGLPTTYDVAIGLNHADRQGYDDQ